MEADTTTEDDDARVETPDVVIDDSTDDLGNPLGGNASVAAQPRTPDHTAGLGVAVGDPPLGGDMVIGEDLFDADPPDPAKYQGDIDPISNAVGHDGYISNQVVDACYETFPDGTWTDPERFERFYFQVPVLIDILSSDAGADERAREISERRVEFKRKWCAANAVNYIVLDEADLRTLDSAKQAVQRAMAGDQEPAEAPAAKPARKPAAARRRASKAGSKVQRPRAPKA